MPDAGPQYDDAGCQLPTGVVLDAADAGLPPGIVLWLQSDIGVATTDGGQICRWEDLSGNGNHFVVGSAAAPQWLSAGLNGKPAVSITGAEYLVRGGVLGIPPTDGRTIATILLNHDLTTRFGVLTFGQANTAGTYLGIDTNTFNSAPGLEGVYFTNNAYQSDLATSAVVRTHVYTISTMVPGMMISAVIEYAVNGSVTTLSRTSGGLGNGLVEDFSGANYVSIGSAQPAFSGAEVGDILVFDGPLTTVQRQQVEAFFSARYP